MLTEGKEGSERYRSWYKKVTQEVWLVPVSLQGFGHEKDSGGTYVGELRKYSRDVVWLYGDRSYVLGCICLVTDAGLEYRVRSFLLRGYGVDYLLNGSSG